MNDKDDDYQVVRDGKFYRLSELSRASLIDELRMAFAALDEVEELLGKSRGVIHRWRFLQKQTERT